MGATRDTTASDAYLPGPGPAADGSSANLFVAMQCEHPTSPVARYRLDVNAVRIGRGSAPASRTQEALERILSITVPDRWMSFVHARIARGGDAWMLEDLGSKNGTLLNGERISRAALADGDMIELGHTFFCFRTASADDDSAASLDADPQNAKGLSTLNPRLAAQMRSLPAMAHSPMPIMLLGESGTGKELLARAMHDLSGRNGPLVAVNCGALPEHLVEAELFGYRKGAFSGAAEDRPGLIRSADRGTLFLDEVGELPLPAQASLLRVLQESEVMPLGATRPVKVDLRVLSATHRDLQSMVELAQFRADLLGRLSGFTLELPPLRERREDLGLIAGALLLRLFPDRAASLRLTPAAARALFRHSWPLNVRELEKCLGTGVALAGDEPVDLKHLPAVLHDPVAFAAPQLTPDDRRQADQIRALLREHGGNISAAAQAMGKARMQIQRWIKRYRIDVREFKH